MERESPHALIDEARRERDEARAILEGRTTPPTAAEAAALEAVGGCWLVTIDWGDGGSPVVDLYSASDVRQYASCSKEEGDLSFCVIAWRALDRDGRPCAWPTVTP